MGGGGGRWVRRGTAGTRDGGLEQVVHDGVERVEARGARLRGEPAARRRARRPRRRTGRARRAGARSISPVPSKVTRCVPGAAPARMPTTSSGGARRRVAARHRPARVRRDDAARERARRARTGGRPCRAGATPRSTARTPGPARTSPRRSRPGGGTAPRRATRLGATTAAAPCSRSRDRTLARRRASQPVAASTNRRLPAVERVRAGWRRPARPRTPRRRRRPRGRAVDARRRRGRSTTGRGQPAAAAAAAIAPPSRPGP